MTLSSRQRSLLATAFAVLLVASPLRMIWAHPSRGWLAPFVAWVGLVLLGAWTTFPERKKS
jgi:hypothetical protein